MIGVAQRFASAGCELATFSEESVLDRMQRVGVHPREFVAGRVTPVTSKLAVVTAESRLAQFNDARFLTNYFKMTIAAPIERHISVLTPAIDEFKPDIVCTDPLLYAVALCAQRAKTPWVSSFTTFVPWVDKAWDCSYRRALESLEPLITKLAARLGSSLRLDLGHCVSPWLNTAYTIPELVSSRDDHASYAVAVGPSRALGERGDETEFPWERLDADRPLVYATSGTQFLFSDRFYRALIEAARLLGAQLVIAGPDAQEINDPSVITVSYAPSSRLIARAAMVINHGGPASVMDCLDQGVPMLVIPLGHDQSWQGHFVARCGAGRTLDHDQATVSDLLCAMGAILEKTSPERSQARRLGGTCRTLDGASSVVDLALELTAR
jgi:UDP:flavonoid glycosyltransferase YjiC (YdhE family)